jgi:hypothetical protein
MQGIIEIDNFRFLTGHGRALAASLERALLKFVAEGPTENNLFICRENRESGAGNWQIYKVEATNLESGVICLEEKCGHQLIFPIEFLSGKYKHPQRKHLIYNHAVKSAVYDEDGNLQSGEFKYIGQTKQGWQKRLQQHVGQAKSGSNTIFHRTMRANDFSIAVTKIMHICLSADEADTEEEKLVYQDSLFPLGLNMIPGGKAGARFLFEHAGPRGEVEADRREEALSEIIRESRKNGANPALSARWSDDAFAIRMICAHRNRLKPNQIENAKLLRAAGHSDASVASMIGAKDPAQVRRMLSGKTYSRVL